MLTTAAALVYTAYQQTVDDNNATIASVKKAENESKPETILHTELDD